MKTYLLTVLPLEWEDWLFESSWAFHQAPPGIIGLAWKSKKEWEAHPLPQTLYVAFIDSQSGHIKHRDSYQQNNAIDEVQLWTGITREDWMISWVASSPTRVLLGLIHWNTPFASAEPIVIDDAKEEMTRIETEVFFTETEHYISSVQIHPMFDDTSPPLVYVSRIVKKHPGKPRRTGLVDSVLQSAWPHGALQTRRVDDDAYKAGVMVDGSSWYLVMFDEEDRKDEEFVVEYPAIGFRKVVQGKPYWRLQITGGPLPMWKLAWKYTFPLRIPAAASPNDDFMEDVIVGASLIAGPTRMLAQQKEQSTIVVAVGLLKKEAIGLPDEQARPLRGGELICLSATGQVVQECKEDIVEQVELCLVGDAVIGVDRIQRRWRLWRWEPLAGKEQFSMVRWLDEEVVHTHVATNHENSDPRGTQYWLVEERPKGLRVSRCDGQTLAETEPPLDLPGWSLPASLERSVGHFDWPIKKGIIGHDDALLLIAADEQSRMVLYRVEAGEGK